MPGRSAWNSNVVAPPAGATVTASSPSTPIAAFEAPERGLYGVQFHPESVLTPDGPHLLANFLRQAGEGEASRLDAAVGSFATQGLADENVPTPGAEPPRGANAAATAATAGAVR